MRNRTNYIKAAFICIVASLFFSCPHPLSNPVDPDSPNYPGTPSVDTDGDGIGSYEDVDEITLASPDDGAVVTTATPVLKTSAFDTDTVTKYWIEISTSQSNFDGNIILNKNDYPSNACTVPSGTLTTLRTYYWRAKAWDGSKWSDTWSEIRSFTLSMDFTDVTGIHPADQETIADTTPTLNWEDVQDAAGYRVQLNDAQDFSGTMLADDSTLTISEYTVPTALNDNTTYYWRVKCKNADGVWGTWSDIWSFTVDIDTSAASSPSPSDTQTISDTTPLLSWSDVSWASGYAVQVNTANDFTGTMIVDDSTLTASQYQIAIGDVLSDNTPYYWRVKCKNADGVWGDWGSTWSFTIFSGDVNYVLHYILNSEDAILDQPPSLSVADYDKDGDLDIFVGIGSTSSLIVLINDGLEHFSKKEITTSNNYNRLSDLYSADLDNDGDIDVIGIDNHEIICFKNDGDGNFNDSIFSNILADNLSVIDIDKDNDIDIIGTDYGADSVNLWKNNGNGAFNYSQLTNNIDGAGEINVCDIDDDGDYDILVNSSFQNKIEWFENNGSGSFTQKTLIPSAEIKYMASADIDSDGDKDLIVADYTSVELLENTGNLNFNVISIESGLAQLNGIVVADLYSDGYPDIFASSWDRDMPDLIIWNNRQKVFIRNDFDSAEDHTSAMNVADIDLDGDLDVLEVIVNDNTYYGSLVWWEKIED